MMKKQNYNFENIFIINTYKCNCNCDFCICKKQKMEENNKKILDQLKKLLFKRQVEYLKNQSNKKIYIKITGGEPFLNDSLIKEIIDISSYNSVYKIGIGTNGTIQLPNYLNLVGSKLAIFFSRHHYLDSIQKEIFNIDLNKKIDLKFIAEKITNQHIQLSCNCNLIKNQIDSIEQIYTYLDWAIEYNLYSVTFRELNKLSIKNKYKYDSYIYEYLKYYKTHVIKINKLHKLLLKSNKFEFTRFNGNFYDTNYWYWYMKNNKKISVKLRFVDEEKMLKYNLKNNFDEWNILPNGELLKSWCE